MPEIGVFFLRASAAMIAGNVGDQFQLVRLEAGQSAVENQVIAVFVVLIVVDQIPDILQLRGRFQQRLVGRIEPERLGQLAENRAGQGRHLLAMGQIDTTAGRECQGRRGPIGRKAQTLAQRAIDHGQQQTIVHATGVHLQAVDLAAPHDGIDDGQSGDDDIDTIGASVPARRAGLGDILQPDRANGELRLAIPDSLGPANCLAPWRSSPWRPKW